MALWSQRTPITFLEEKNTGERRRRKKKGQQCKGHYNNYNLTKIGISFDIAEGHSQDERLGCW